MYIRGVLSFHFHVRCLCDHNRWVPGGYSVRSGNVRCRGGLFSVVYCRRKWSWRLFILASQKRRSKSANVWSVSINSCPYIVTQLSASPPPRLSRPLYPLHLPFYRGYIATSSSRARVATVLKYQNLMSDRSSRCLHS